MKLFKSDFLKNVGKLFTGSLIAQVIGFVALIFLAKIYTPEEFGELDTYLKMAGVVVAIAGLRYEIAIVVEDDVNLAQDITRLSLFLNTAITLIVFIGVLLFKSYISELFHLDHPNLLYLLPLLVWLMSGTEILVNWRNRAKDYNTISTNRIISSATNVSYKFGHPLQLYISSNGLVLGTILGQLIAFFHIIRKLQFSIISTSKEALKAVATKYKSFALFSTPAALVNILAVNMPWFMIAAFDGQSATGQFGNAYKLTYLPISMLGMALGQVFFEQISRLKTDKTESASVSHELVNLMFTAALIPVIVLAVWGDIIAPWLLGDTWQEAGVYIQITILFYFSMFLTSSFSSAFSTYGKLSQQLVYNVTFLIGTSAALYFGYTIGGDTRTALLWFAIVGTTLRLFILNYFFVLFGKNLIAKTIFAIILVALLLWLGFGIKDGF